jgi:hypothetical protein
LEYRLAELREQKEDDYGTGDFEEEMSRNRIISNMKEFEMLKFCLSSSQILFKEI